MAWEQENQVYRRVLDELLGTNDVNEGKFVVVKGDGIQGPFATYESALGHGYAKHGLDSFLVRKIERHQAVLFFSRDLI